MKPKLATDDLARLGRSAERIAQLVTIISDPKHAPAIGTGPMPRAMTGAVAREPRSIAPLPGAQWTQAARDAIRSHRALPDFGVPALFRNWVWVFMLELFVAEQAGIAMSVKAACIAIGGGRTTALRRILDLERAGLLESHPDPGDARRRLLVLTSGARGVLCRFLARQPDRPA